MPYMGSRLTAFEVESDSRLAHSDYPLYLLQFPVQQPKGSHVKVGKDPRMTVRYLVQPGIKHTCSRLVGITGCLQEKHF